MNIEEINKLPKIDLHLHLDGSIPLEIATKLCSLNEIKLKELMIAKDKCENLTEYLTRFSLPIDLMHTKENLTLITKKLIDNLINQNVIYTEIRFAPMFHTKQGLTYEDVIEAVLNGMRSNKIKTNLILCLMRGANEEDNLKTVYAAKKYLIKVFVLLI